MLRSELRALRNTIRTKDGQQALLGAVIVFVCLLVGGLSLGSILTQDEWLAPLADVGTGLFGAACGALLVMPALLVLAFAKIPSRAQLFEGSHVPALLSSPVGTGRIVRAVWLRQTAFAFVCAVAIAAVPVVAMVVRASLPTAAVFGFLAILLLVAGATAAVVVMVVVLTTRFGSSPRRRRVLMVGHLGMILVVMVLLLSGVTRGERVREWLLDVAPGESAIGGMLAEAAAVPVWLAGAGRELLSVLRGPLVLVAVATLALAVASVFYRRAFEALLCATDTVAAHRSGTWPHDAVRSLVRRGFVEAWRAKGNLVLVGLFGAFVVWRIADRPFAPIANDSAPLVREVFFLQSGWLMLASILSMLLFLGVIGDEQKQLSLLATSPLSRRSLLRSRELLLGWPLLLTALMAVLAGRMVGGVSWSGCLLYLLGACPLALILLGAVLAVGSWPAFIQLKSDLPLASNVRTVVPVLVLSVVAAGLLYGQHQVRRELIARGGAQADLLLPTCIAYTVTWLAAIAIYLLFTKVALRNLERLLGPQP